MFQSLLISIVIIMLFQLPTTVGEEFLIGANWDNLYGDKSGSNFNPQEEITSDNAIPLELKWLHPLPSAKENPDVFRVAEGVEHPPLVVDGIVYFVKGNEQIFALNARDGRLIWTREIEFNPIDRPIVTSLIHTHGLQISNGTIYYLSNDCTMYAIDILSGQDVFRMDDICSYVEGNEGFYSPSYPPAVYEKGGILIVAPAGGAHGPRGFVAGYDLETKGLLWRWFVVPPSGGHKEWAINAQGKGNVEPLPGDWGSSKLFGGGGVWTRFAIDEETGIVYFGTGNPAPLFNATLRPGPNLFTSSIIALDATTGELVWYYQTTPHDIGDFDCSWNTILASVKLNGDERKVVIQGCKNGYIYALDAKTGNPIWEPLMLPGIARVNDLNTNEGKNADMDAGYAVDPDLWENGFYMQCPSLTGAIETPNAFAYNTLFVGAKSDCILIAPGQVSERPPPFFPLAGADELRPAAVAQNSTVFAIDASTGEIKWSFLVESSTISGGCCMVSGNVVYFGDVSGKLYALDAKNGNLLWVRRLGATLAAFPSIGATADGEIMLFVPVSGGPSADVPGAIIALGLPSVSEDLDRQSSINMITTGALAIVAFSAVIYAIWLRTRYLKRNLALSK